MAHHGVTVVFDVGANTGQYATELRTFGYSGSIVSFEPLADAYRQLALRAAEDARWLTARQALGAEEGKTTINVAGNSFSSSLLPMLPLHVQAYPESAYVRTEEVEVATLDKVFPTYCGQGERPFLKVDTQGFERQVLRGARESLPSMTGIQLEMSMEPLYEGEMLFDEALETVRGEGFRLMSVEPGFFDAATGRLLQLDGIFYRPESAGAGK